jgi:uncharacterized alpha-E superfamily protein
MISRVAENCFWLSRYMERVETLARLLDVNLAFVLDVVLSEDRQWAPLVLVSGEEEAFAARHGAKALLDGEKVQHFLTWEQANPCSLYQFLHFGREAARTVRETISLEMWEAVNGMWTWMNERPTRRLYNTERSRFFGYLRERCLLFQGVCYNTMLHEEPFDFMRLGTALERARQTAQILDVKHHRVGPMISQKETPADAAQWLATLRSCVGVESFLKRSANTLTGNNVAQFLLFEATFPHSVLHNLQRAHNFAARIREEAPPRIGKASYTAIDRLVRRVGSTSIDTVVSKGLHEFLGKLVTETDHVCTAIDGDFFHPSVRAASAG